MPFSFIFICAYLGANLFFFLSDKDKYKSIYYIGVDQKLNNIMVFFRYMLFGSFFFQSNKKELERLDYVIYHYYLYKSFMAGLIDVIKSHYSGLGKIG